MLAHAVGEIVNRGSGQCLSVDQISHDAGERLVQYYCYGGLGQQWYLGVSGSNVLGLTTYLQSRLSGKFVDVNGASWFEGAGIDQYYFNGNWNQVWTFQPAAG